MYQQSLSIQQQFEHKLIKAICHASATGYFIKWLKIRLNNNQWNYATCQVGFTIFDE